ncbi:MAG: hypothetical protein RSA66_10475, partial [Muribaculaceae bacterium]
KILDMDVCKTDMQKIVKYLSDAAVLYDRQQGQRNVCRAWVIRQMTRKINNKLFTQKINKHEKN